MAVFSVWRKMFKSLKKLRHRLGYDLSYILGVKFWVSLLTDFPVTPTFLANISNQMSICHSNFARRWLDDGSIVMM